MPQHLWRGALQIRSCEVCGALQSSFRGEWAPSVGPICPGDDDDGGRPAPRPKPNAPSGAPRVLEPA
jgi:hypothetical protein